MKNKNFLTIILFFLFSLTLNAQDNGWRFLNHESGGYVTSIIPIKYSSGQQPSTIDGQVLYARTDIGGIYRSGNNGLRWDFNSCYFRTPPGRNFAEVTASEFHVQGFAGRFNNRDGGGVEHDVLVVATGHYYEDANNIGFKTIWHSSDNGNTGTFTQATINGSPGGIWFKGNDFLSKIGGECIIYDPNNINGSNSQMYAGGFYPSQNGGPCYLYKSTNDGISWYRDIGGLQNFPSGTYSNEGIICIAMKPGSDHIWVGTTHRVVFSTNNGSSWNTRNIGSFSTPYVKRIILQGSGNDLTAYAVWGDWFNTGICKFPTGSHTYTDLTSNFGSGGSGLFSSLAFVDDAESIIIAGKYENPLKTTANDGSSWSSAIELQYTSGYSAGNPNFHNFPNHQDNIELSAYMYDGLSNLTRNPNGSLISGAGNQWYLSGGAGPRKTAPDHGVVSNNFVNSRWQYTVKGQSMPVMYDIVFHNLNFNSVDKPATFMPMSDWTMSWEYSNNLAPAPPDWLIPAPLKYDRKITEMCEFDTYISNVTRILFNPDDPNLAYCVGGSVYDYSNLPFPCNENRFAGFYQRRDNDGSGSSFTLVRKENSPFLNISNRAIVDAIMYKTPGNANRIVALVGQSEGQVPPNGSTLGVFYSDNGGDSWSSGTFDETSGDQSISTEDAYYGSQLPALINGTLGDLFDGHFGLGHIGGTILCLWLEQAGNNTGGIFISLNNGESWSRQNVPSELTSGAYLGPGSVKPLGSNKVGLVVRKGSGNNAGVYTGTVNTTNGSISWDNSGNSRWNFISAEHLDVLNGKWAVYGRRSGDNEDQLYKSLNDGNSWTRIPEGFTLPLFAKVNALRIKPNSNELWIATSGQGVFIYRQFQPADNPAPWIITENTTVNYTDYNDRDIIVRNGARLTLQGSAGNNLQWDMGPERSITVEEGSSIIAEYVNFNSPLGKWLGVSITSGVGSTFFNCNFTNTVNPITITNPNFDYSFYPKVISNCSFTLPGGSNYAIYCSDVSSCKIEYNVFNLTGSSTATGIKFENVASSLGGAGGSGGGDLPAPVLAITNNSFNGGAMDISLLGLGSSLTYFYMAYNVFQGTSGNNGYGLWARRISGKFKSNTFTSNNYLNAVQLLDCSIDMYSNTLTSQPSGGQSTNITLDENSSALLAPVIDGNGDYYWYGGYNNITMNNGSGSSSCANITFTSGASLMGDLGRNCFTLGFVSNNNNITGELTSCGRSYQITKNGWNNGPTFDIVCDGSPVTVDYTPTITCATPSELSASITGYQVNDLGQGVYDTVLITSEPGGSGTGSELSDGALYASILRKVYLKDYSGSIADAKDMINTRPESEYLLSSLDELYLAYQKTDSTGNQSNTNSLFGELKEYLEQKMGQYENNSGFVNKCYSYYLMCLVNMKNYSGAISGYENIINNNPNPIACLTANWDRAAVTLLMQGSGGGLSSSADEVINEEELLDKKPADRIARDNFKDQKVSLERKPVSDKKAENIKNMQRKLADRIVVFNPANRKQLNIKIDEDIRILLNLRTNSISEEGIIPGKFELSQNYPNPFNPLTKINFSIPKSTKVVMQVYDILGKLVKTLVNDFKEAGSHNVSFDGTGLASGVYFYRIEAGSFIESKKMVLVK